VEKKAKFKLNKSQEKALDVLLKKDATHVLLYSGSRSGKSLLLCRLLIIRALKAPRSNHAILRRYFNDVKTKIGMITLPEALESLGMAEGAHYSLDRSNWILSFPNNSKIWLGGLDDDQRANKILGSKFSTLFFEECDQISYDSVQKALTRLEEKHIINGKEMVNRAWYACNPPLKTHWTYKHFIEKPKKNHLAVKLEPKDNQENLNSNYFSVFEDMDLVHKQRFLYGEFQDLKEGALWKHQWFKHDKQPELDKIVIGVDPAVTNKKESDETGIVVAGLKDGIGYVLEDRTGKYSANEWANEVVKLYHKYDANYVVAETNQGGDLIETVIQNFDNTVPLRKVHAYKGKLLRAEPIAYQYERGNVIHCTDLEELEYELIIYDGTGKSPNRMDACVYALTELLGNAMIDFDFAKEALSTPEDAIDLGNGVKQFKIKRETEKSTRELVEDEAIWTDI